MPDMKFSLQPAFQEKLYRLESLMPLFKEKLLSPLPKKLKKYDLPLYQRDNGQFVLHRIVKVGQTYTCIGDNQYIYETGVRHDQMIGLVTGFYRGEKFYKVNSLSHRLYRCLWHRSRWLRPRVRAVISKVKRCIKK